MAKSLPVKASKLTKQGPEKLVGRQTVSVAGAALLQALARVGPVTASEIEAVAASITEMMVGAYTTAKVEGGVVRATGVEVGVAQAQAAAPVAVDVPPNLQVF
jgi:hypothetical protein